MRSLTSAARFSLLAGGRFPEGFAEYEWRWKVMGDTPRAAVKPAWDGGPLEGRTILLFPEQGLGDTLQFARYATLVAARGGRVIVECQPAAVQLVRSVEGVADVVSTERRCPQFDVQCALMSLPGRARHDCGDNSGGDALCFGGLQGGPAVCAAPWVRPADCGSGSLGPEIRSMAATTFVLSLWRRWRPLRRSRESSGIACISENRRERRSEAAAPRSARF